MYASLWLGTSPFPHPSSLASSYRYLISCVGFCLPLCPVQLTHVSCGCWVEQHRQRGGGWSLLELAHSIIARETRIYKREIKTLFNCEG